MDGTGLGGDRFGLARLTRYVMHVIAEEEILTTMAPPHQGEGTEDDVQTMIATPAAATNNDRSASWGCLRPALVPSEECDAMRARSSRSPGRPAAGPARRSRGSHAAFAGLRFRRRGVEILAAEASSSAPPGRRSCSNRGMSSGAAVSRCTLARRSPGRRRRRGQAARSPRPAPGREASRPRPRGADRRAFHITLEPIDRLRLVGRDGYDSPARPAGRASSARRRRGRCRWRWRVWTNSTRRTPTLPPATRPRTAPAARRPGDAVAAAKVEVDVAAAAEQPHGQRAGLAAVQIDPVQGDGIELDFGAVQVRGARISSCTSRLPAAGPRRTRSSGGGSAAAPSLPAFSARSTTAVISSRS